MLTSTDMALCGLDPHALFAPVANCQTVGLAVSGGADSLALMLLYAAWSGDRPRAVVYTVDHRLRPEAQAEAAMVVAEAEKPGLTCRSLVWDGPKPSSGKQSAARSARYRLMAKAMAADGAEVLVTAHHLRDQAETVLMRLAHGSGVTGLAGMRDFSVVEGVEVFRPLLGVPAETLATLVARAGLSPVHDPSNADPAYERTRWRNALPALGELGLTPAILGKAGERMARIDAFAARAADEFAEAHMTRDALGVLRIARAALDHADPEIGIRAIDIAVAAVSGARSFALGRIEELAARLASGERFAATLAGARLVAQENAIVIHREAGRHGLPTTSLAPGESVIWDGRFSITASRAGTIVPASGLTRKRFRDLTGKELEGPVAGLRAAPLICDARGEIAAIGCLEIAEGFAVEQIPLTSRAGNCGNRPPGGAVALVSPE
ncbi:tRNA(Ile)-lysidine synthetase [Pelagibacterium halotolerans B2]|uniref:tRNA(Ile)-lysidine synthase n=1 Tax=Pelagibacterium halotolerans (strain DSM 22347 / JCM 15775 / CGMCC 1.7692 / B2) TaxID=1082931 RepID=G4R975_PELHB|nr:tRNA lysidine(34) synthetase TilS [Pelagibacterium halotolerans]AEQ52455.1 tRNA(Ile)-lysidine synthetase [Pelagibacterium halotolerans B2]